MLPASALEHDGALSALDCGFTAIAVALSFAWPRLNGRFVSGVESALGKLARRKALVVLLIGVSALLLRIAILALFPVPLPFLPDDFSFLLAGDTFAHGRLTNPTPAMWTHFETIQVSMQPTYTSMYFPGLGLILAAGKVAFGHPWCGILIVVALMCSAICWMLQGWIPPGWALLGGVLAILRLGLFSTWINMYSGAGPLLALGGALVLGSVPRLMRTSKLRYGAWMGLGAAILVLTRPWEGMLLCVPVAILLSRWSMKKNRERPFETLKLASLPVAMAVTALGWLAYYDYRAYGHPLTLPYTVNRATYAMVPYFIWQPLRSAPAYRHREMRDFYEWEKGDYLRAHSWKSFVPSTAYKGWYVLQFFAAYTLLPPLIMLPRVLRDRRLRFLMVGTCVLAAAGLSMVYLIPHYVAPFAAAFYAIGLQAMRHLRCWKPEGRPVGATLVRTTVMLCFLLAGVRLLSGPLHLTVSEWPLKQSGLMWYGPDHWGVERSQVQSYLDHLPGKQLAIVRYARHREPLNQWVYNGADIDGSKVVWAGELDADSDRELLRYYGDRRAWLIEPDETPARVSPYPIPKALAVARR